MPLRLSLDLKEQIKKIVLLPESTNQSGIDTILAWVRQKVDAYVTSKTPEVFKEILNILDILKSRLNGLSRDQIVSTLHSLHKAHTDIWESFIWEEVKIHDPTYHENNDIRKYNKTGITPDALIKVVEQYKENRVTMLVLKLAEIYGLKPEILVNIFHRGYPHSVIE